MCTREGFSIWARRILVSVSILFWMVDFTRATSGDQFYVMPPAFRLIYRKQHAMHFLYPRRPKSLLYMH